MESMGTFVRLNLQSVKCPMFIRLTVLACFGSEIVLDPRLPIDSN